ncbi:MAG: hypothetical protein AAFN70_15885, partial [Planctomycetota bacterium]
MMPLFSQTAPRVWPVAILALLLCAALVSTADAQYSRRYGTGSYQRRSTPSRSSNYGNNYRSQQPSNYQPSTYQSSTPYTPSNSYPSTNNYPSSTGRYQTYDQYGRPVVVQGGSTNYGNQPYTPTPTYGSTVAPPSSNSTSGYPRTVMTANGPITILNERVVSSGGSSVSGASQSSGGGSAISRGTGSSEDGQASASDMLANMGVDEYRARNITQYDKLKPDNELFKYMVEVIRSNAVLEERLTRLEEDNAKNARLDASKVEQMQREITTLRISQKEGDLQQRKEKQQIAAEMDTLRKELQVAKDELQQSESIRRML